MTGQETHSDPSISFSTGLAVPGLYVFAFTFAFSPTLMNLGMALILTGTLVALPRFWEEIRRQPVFWLSVMLVVYIVLRSVLALQEFPDLGGEKNPHWTDLVRATPLFAIPLGWWLYRHPRHIAPILISAVAGLFAGVLNGGHWDLILDGRFAEDYVWRYRDRFIWGYNPNFLGLASAAAILTIGAWFLSHGWISRWRIGLWVVAGLSLLLLGGLLYASQSRSAWLGFLLGSLCLGAWAFARDLGRDHGWWRAGILFGVVAASVLVSILVIDEGGLVTRRVLREWNTFALLWGGNLDAAADAGGPLGKRIAMWVAGVHALAERPWFGWGPGSGPIMSEGGFIEEPLTHFHNIYLELLVSLGLVGFGLAAATGGVLVVAAIRATRYGLWSSAMAGGLLAVTVLTAVALLFAIQFGQPAGRAFLRMLEAVFVVAVFRVSAFYRNGAARISRQNTELG